MAHIAELETGVLAPAFHAVLAFVNDGTLPDGVPAPRARERALVDRVRRTLRDYLVERSPEQTSAMNALAEAFPVGLRFDVRDGLPACRLDPAATGFVGHIAWMIAVLHDGLAAGYADRIKLCHNDECGWLFLDESRNRSRVWCDMARCGSRMKARAYRARQRDERAAS